MAHFLNIETNNANAQWFPILSPSTLDSGLFTLSSSPVPMHESNVYIANDYTSIMANGYPQYTSNNDFDINAIRGSRLPGSAQDSACLPTSTLFDFDFNNQFSFLPPSPASPSTSLNSQISSPAYDNNDHSINSAASGIINSNLLGFGHHHHPANGFDMAVPVSAINANTSPVIPSGDAAQFRKPTKRASTSVSASKLASPSIAASSQQSSPSLSAMQESPIIPSKKPRASVSAKDFVPPDVTGLSKREARLVKNRAAAFLSRQRKREEFECMEVRVAELERENARLQALLESTSSLSSSSQDASSSPSSASSSASASMATLRAQLTASQQREHELIAQINRLHTSLSSSSSSSTPPSSSSGSQSPHSPSFSSFSSINHHHMKQNSSSSMWNYEPELELDSSLSTSSSSEASTPLTNGYNNALNY